MTKIEKKSLNKKNAIIQLVKTGEMSIAFALLETERLNDEGKLLDIDYEELAEYLDNLLFSEDNKIQDKNEEEIENNLENTEDSNLFSNQN